MIIGICGQINTGKDTVADILCGEYGFLRVSFADPIKIFCLKMFPDLLDDKILWGPSPERTPKTRELLQQLGTEVARKFDPNVWVKHTFLRIQQLQKTGIDPMNRLAPTKPGRSVVIPDIRFLNEVQKLRKIKAHLIKLTRPGNYKLAGTKTSARKHVSETGIALIPSELFFTHINNNGSIKDLRSKIHEILTATRLFEK